MKLFKYCFSIFVACFLANPAYANHPVRFSNRTNYTITLGTNSVSTRINPYTRGVKFPVAFESGKRVAFTINSNGRIHITSRDGQLYYMGVGNGDFSLYFQGSDIDWMLFIDEDYDALPVGPYIRTY